MLLRNNKSYQTCLENYQNKTMKTIELTPNEFYDFKEVAKKFKIFFTCTVIAGIVLVDADAVMLDYIGY